MKHLSHLLLSFLLLSCFAGNAQEFANAKTKSGKNNANVNMRGAYQLLRQVANDGTKDSLMNNQQLKIFTDRHMIYVHPAADDSLAVFGIGTYKIENGKVVENIFYTSDTGPVNQRYELDINKSGDGFSQVITIPDAANNKTWLLTEDYKRVNKNITTPLDGAWKQTKVMFIANNGTTQTNSTPTQFKVFQSGNFVWASTYKDSATNKPVSVYGYGTFKMNSKKEMQENTSRSTYKTQLVDKPVTLQIELIGKDKFRQTINWPEGKHVEEYERLQ